MKLKDLYRELLINGKANGIPEIDVRELISYYQKYEDLRAFFLRLDEDVINEKKIRSDFKRMMDGYPVAYISHRTTFLGNYYYIDEHVLIPRPETEELVVNTFMRIPDIFKKKKLKILDVGTGSGVIAIELAKKLEAEVSATDISKAAIKVAQKNAKYHHVNVNFFVCDTYPQNHDKYDIIISNPPYILNKKDADKNVIDFEPNEALLLTEKNNVYEKILKDVKNRLNRPGFVIFEMADNIEAMIKKLIATHLKDFDGGYVVFNDINKKHRFMAITLEK